MSFQFHVIVKKNCIFYCLPLTMTRSEIFSFLFNINNISAVLIDKDMYILKIKTASLSLKIILMKKKHLANVIQC